jgi:hypothetical protein
MTRWQIGLLSIFILCGLALNNPDRVAYEIYAVEQIGNLARDQCHQAPGEFSAILQGPCRAAIEAFKPQIRPLLAAKTTRQNWILFSIYRSQISIPAVHFSGQVESIGIFNNFFIYKTS